jgi:hypothetical protein
MIVNDPILHLFQWPVLPLVNLRVNVIGHCHFEMIIEQYSEY